MLQLSIPKKRKCVHKNIIHQVRYKFFISRSIWIFRSWAEKHSDIFVLKRESNLFVSWSIIHYICCSWSTFPRWLSLFLLQCRHQLRHHLEQTVSSSHFFLYVSGVVSKDQSVMGSPASQQGSFANKSQNKIFTHGDFYEDCHSAVDVLEVTVVFLIRPSICHPCIKIERESM